MTLDLRPIAPLTPYGAATAAVIKAVENAIGFDEEARALRIWLMYGADADEQSTRARLVQVTLDGVLHWQLCDVCPDCKAKPSDSTDCKTCDGEPWTARPYSSFGTDWDIKRLAGMPEDPWGDSPEPDPPEPEPWERVLDEALPAGPRRARPLGIGFGYGLVNDLPSP